MSDAVELAPLPAPAVRAVVSNRTTVGRRPSDRWNPLLVKEVRQALRGKAFRVAFMLALVAALLVALGSALDQHMRLTPQQARAYFQTVYSCLVLALVGFVPFTAFQSMAAEWDESTFDLLELSNLRPARIVIGKLQAVAVQIMLFFAIFAPLLSIAALLPGIDLLTATFVLLLAVVVSLCASLLGLTLATLSRQRFAKVALMVALGFAVAMAFGGLQALTFEIMRAGVQLLEPEFLAGAGMAAAVLLLGSSYVFALACNMLAHPEENRSTNVRLITTIGAIAIMALVAFVHRIIGSGPEFIAGMAMSGLVVVSIPGVLFCTERAKLGRRAAHAVPASRTLALVTAPWHPGGGRGVVLHLFHVALITTAGLCIITWLRPSPSDLLADGVGALLLLALFAVVYVIFLPALCTRYCERFQSRMFVRLAVPLTGLLLIFLPVILSALAGARVEFDHLGNPFRNIQHALDQDDASAGIYILFTGLALLAVLVNLPRMIGAFLETWNASERNEALHGQVDDVARRDVSPEL